MSYSMSPKRLLAATVFVCLMFVIARSGSTQQSPTMMIQSFL
jgi:hypothetical protein